MEMKKALLITALGIIFSIHWGVPLKMIYDNEIVISRGKPYRFKTQPIDPSDPLRGAYITLNYEINSYETDKSDWDYGDDVFVILAEDSLGFAKIKDVRKIRPALHTDFVVAKYLNHYNGRLNFELPFNRFYMNEEKAYDAELAYSQAQRDSLPDNSFALVFVKQGKAVLADVLVNGTSVTNLNQPKNQ